MDSPTHPAIHASPRIKIIIKFLVNQFNNHHTGKTFRELLQQPAFDERSLCVEWYSQQNMICMVRLIDGKNPEKVLP